ncbi:MAG: DUF885 domain-containing protein [Bacteroidetes bacterium]|nr:DUF885 domain-containing protein [Bacteroidota bacterium]
MKKYIPFLLLLLMISACGNNNSAPANKDKFQKLLDKYWETRMQLFPLEATGIGDYRYNDKMTITISESFRDSLKRFYQNQLDELTKIDTAKLDEEQQLSYKLLKYEMNMGIEGLKFPAHYLPTNQFWGLTLDLPQLGSGKGNQPFKTVKDYEDFLKRMAVFPAWVDTAIFNMKKGIVAGWVLPKALVLKIMPQLSAIVVKDVKQSIFYEPITDMPKNFSPEDKQRITAEYEKAISDVIIMSYKKLYDYFDKEYLPIARTTSGVGALPGGVDYYTYCARYWTTTTLSPDSIYNIGLAELARIEGEMNGVKDATGFKGDMHSFFDYLSTSAQFFPFNTEQEVIDSFWNIKKQEEPVLKKIFNNVPKSPFTIRQTEKFREASASAEYNPGSEDGTRPGIFYVPIINPKKYNAVGMETLFLHEAIPGHHYQIALAQENGAIPKFRRFLWYGAYGEGWALYSETLGKELGLFSNPYQYFGHLSDAMHRAIRLVVDVAIHTKGMTREEAITYMRAHENVSEEEATREIERYMAIPGQALSYKIGQLSISALRKKYEQQLDAKFHLASFHDEVLKDGCVPLDVLDAKLEKWAKKQ